MYIDIKIEEWERINVPDNLEEEFKNKIRRSEITDALKAISYLLGHTEIVHEKLPGTKVLLTPKCNNGEATFQVYDDHHNIFFSNDI